MKKSFRASEAKRRYRKELYEKYIKKCFPKSKNWAQVEFLKHAEAHSLLRAKNYLEKRGLKMPEEMIMVVDKATCQWCQNDLPYLMKHLGIKRMIIFCEGQVMIIPTTEKQKEKMK